MKYVIRNSSLWCNVYGNIKSTGFLKTNSITQTLKLQNNYYFQKTVRAFSALHKTKRYVQDTLILDGKELSENIIDLFPKRVKEAQQYFNVTESSIPGLGVIIVGNRRDSARYVEKKLLAVEKAGFHSKVIHLDETATEEQIISNVHRLNNDRMIHGILVQLPLPSQINQLNVLNSINVQKDVDGFHPLNMGFHALNVNGNLEMLEWSIADQLWPTKDLTQMQRIDWLMPNVACAPKACMLLLDHYGISVAGKKVVILGQSSIVGIPAIFMFMHANAIVSTANEKCGDKAIRQVCREADIVLTAVGKAHLLTRDYLKEGAIVLDVGINFLSRTTADRKFSHTEPNIADVKEGLELVGDANLDDLIGYVGGITPVPGGVGPMTVAMLLENTFLNFIHMHRNDW